MLDVVASLVSELLAVSGILVLLMFVPGPKYMSDEKKSRRRFLSGGAAAPFIMTVHPGSVLAASSTACFVNAGKQATPTLLPDPGTVAPNAPDPDIWLRWGVELLELTNNTTKAKEPGFFFLPYTGAGALGQKSKYWEFVNNDTAPKLTNIDVGGIGWSVSKSTGQFKRALVLVDSNGTIVAFHWEGSVGGSKITKSCYTSFKPVG